MNLFTLPEKLHWLTFGLVFLGRTVRISCGEKSAMESDSNETVRENEACMQTRRRKSGPISEFFNFPKISQISLVRGLQQKRIRTELSRGF